MKTITQDFEQALKSIKQIDAVISYADRENTNFIITQNSEYLQTEAQDFLVTESANVIIDNGGIQNCNIYWNTDILKSVCKMLDLETSNAIPKGTELFVKIGLLVDGEYEYVNYGSFITTQDSEKKLDEGTYLTTAYDKMVQFSINASENPLTFETGVTYTLKQYLEMICSKCSVPSSLGNLSSNTNANLSIIDSDPYAGNKNVTYRDIINDIAECLGTNFIIDSNGKFNNKDLSITSVMALDEQNLKDTNVNIGEKKESIDGVQVYDGTTMLNYAGLDNSVFKIKNNNIMSKKSSQLLSYVLTKIQGFSYYAFNINTFGVLALEPFDCFTTSANNTNYLLCALHNEISANQGLGEEISYEFKDEDATIDYSTTSDEDKQRNAYIEIDKANSQVVLKANANGNIVQAELTADPSTGSSFNVKADNVNFEGKTFNLTSENINIASNNFSVNSNGILTCNGATFRDGEIKLVDTENISDILKIYKYWDNGDGVWKSIIHLHGYDGSDTDLYPGWIQIVSGDGETYTDIDGGTIECDNLYVRNDKNRLVRISDNEGVLLGAYETATPYFGDIGSDKTNKEGYCKIMIDDVFAQTIENDDYKVFIQKCGDGDLYVEKYKDYFEVKGTPNLDFDWELKAIQKGYKDRRLERKEMKPLKGDDN